MLAAVCRHAVDRAERRVGVAQADYCFMAMHGTSKDELLEAAGVVLDSSKQDNAAEVSTTANAPHTFRAASF